VTKLSEERLTALLQKLGQRSEPEKREVTPVPLWQYPAQQKQFHILDHIEVRRKAGRNWIRTMSFVRRVGSRQKWGQPGHLG